MKATQHCWKKIKADLEISHVSGVKRLWIYLLSQACQIHNYLQNSYLWKRPKPIRKYLLQLKIGKRSGLMIYNQVPYPWVYSPQAGKYLCCRVFPRGVKALHPHLASSPEVWHWEDKLLKHLVLRTCGAQFRSPIRPQEMETSFLECTQISSSPGLSAK